MAATVRKIAIPPSMAVGFLCQRSVLGFATAPHRRAKFRTTGVRISESTKAPATVAASSHLKIIICDRSDGRKSRTRTLADHTEQNQIESGFAYLSIRTALSINDESSNQFSSTRLRRP